MNKDEEEPDIFGVAPPQAWFENDPMQVQIISANDLLKRELSRPMTMEALARISESAYRRGYQQGAHAALKAIEYLVGKHFSTFSMWLANLQGDWVGRQLHDWRYGKNRVAAELPPTPKACISESRKRKAPRPTRTIQ